MLWIDGEYPLPIGPTELWIPTDVEIGSIVPMHTYDVEVIGETILSVEGNPVEVWQLYTPALHQEGHDAQTTSYYEKSTGLLISAAWVEWDENDHVWASVAIHLSSTNVPLPVARLRGDRDDDD